MKAEACKSPEARSNLLKYGSVLLPFIVFALIFAVYAMDFLKLRNIFNNKGNNSIKNSKLTIPQDSPDLHSFCKVQPLSLDEAFEVTDLLDSIAWPDTPPLSSPLTLIETSDPAQSTFTILPRSEWHMGDQLVVLIKMCDYLGHPKSSGGDVLLARLHNPILEAGVAGQVVDHLNGSYSAVFSLLWEGIAEVEITLVHPSEAVTVLRRLNTKQPDRYNFKSLFRSGSVNETTTCNVCLRPTQPMCNYTNKNTGDPWFCYKPQNLSCEDRINHLNGTLTRYITAEEKMLFSLDVNMKVPILASGPANITVLPKKTELKSRSVKPGPSGYYYQGVWQSLDGTTVQQFNISDINQCLKEKVIHMYGDSTMRQWFEYFISELPDLIEFNLHNHWQSGPRWALDYTNNILMTYRCHGPPIHFAKVPITELRYIADELQSIAGGNNTVVIFSVWAHFSTFPIEFYIRRLTSIRSAVLQLLARAPETVVIIRTANVKMLTLYSSMINSDWCSLQHYKALKAVFKGMNVHLVDAWEMTVAHHLPHQTHPQPPIIKNMINVVLSYVCPQKDS